MTTTGRRVLIASAIVAAVALVAVIFVFDPSQTPIYPRCPSKLITGYDCPGCGSLRAAHALVHGDFATAWAFNPALFFAIPLAVLFFWGDSRRSPKVVSRIVHHPLTPVMLLVALVAWTVARNL